MDEVYKLLKNTDDAFQRESAESRIALEDEMKAQGSGMPRAPPPAKPTWSAKVDLAPKVVSPDKPVVSFAEIVRAEEEQLREAAKQGAGKKAAATKKKAVSTTAQFSAELAAKAQQKRKAAAKQKKAGQLKDASNKKTSEKPQQKAAGKAKQGKGAGKPKHQDKQQVSSPAKVKKEAW